MVITVACHAIDGGSIPLYPLERRQMSLLNLILTILGVVLIVWGAINLIHSAIILGIVLLVVGILLVGWANGDRL